MEIIEKTSLAVSDQLELDYNSSIKLNRTVGSLNISDFISISFYSKVGLSNHIKMNQLRLTILVGILLIISYLVNITASELEADQGEITKIVEKSCKESIQMVMEDWKRDRSQLESNQDINRHYVDMLTDLVATCSRWSSDN